MFAGWSVAAFRWLPPHRRSWRAISGGVDGSSEWREASQPLPPAGSPNVLLIVLDTVAAGHLGLYGYTRPTSPTIDELAAQGVRFDRARATSSWTLPSHAGMFTGRWPHELYAGFLTPLDRTFPPWPNTSARAVSPRPASWPITRIAPPTRGSIAVSPFIVITFFPDSPRSVWPP